MKRLIVLLLVISGIASFAQVDQKAKNILDNVSQKTKANKSITADFEFTMDNAEVELHETSRGKIIIQGNAYKLVLTGIEIYCDGETMWTFVKDANEVNISSVEDSDDSMINPATIFTIYEQGYKNTYLGEYTADGKKTFKIEMIPDEIKEFSRVILEIDQASYQIVSAVMNGTDDNTYSIKVTSMDTSKSYSATDFSFNEKKHSGVDVIDMR